MRSNWSNSSLVTVLTCFNLFRLVQHVQATREVVTFDFGWKHRTGRTDWAKPNDLPPKITTVGMDPPEAAPHYDDSDWWDIQLPHDGLIANPPSTTACPDGCSGKSFIPRHVLWYRKTFRLPSEWGEDSTVWLEFEGSFRNTTVWVNGQVVANHVCGYTPFRVPLNSARSGEKQVIAVYVDPIHGSGWWYEGGGLYRHVKLYKTSRVAHVQPHALFAKSHVTPTKTTLDMEATIELQTNVSDTIGYFFQITSPDGQVYTSPLKALPQNTHQVRTIQEKDWPVPQPIHFWTTSTPQLYQIDVVLQAKEGKTLDLVTTYHGIRTIRFDATQGFFLNEKHFKIRGFCDHDTFAVVGMAVPDRVNLFRAQASRSIGGNGRRTSHNPPDPTILDIYDRLGMVVMPENRLFGNNSAYVQNMADLVQRDRNHPSVVIWSFCNEGNCEGPNEAGGPAFQAVTTRLDGTRPTLANMFTFNDLLSNTVDVQGFSHQSREKLDQCHKAMPHKPIFMSECCSCNTMRGQDEGKETTHDNPKGDENQKAFNARCLDQLVNASDGVAYSAGTMVWTLFDYYGEPPSRGNGHTVSSTYGQFDLCGFPKSAGFWFRTQWLLGVSDEAEDKPFGTKGAYEVHIVESWESPDSWNATKNDTRTIHAYTNAPSIELYVNGKSQGARPVVPMIQGSGGSYAEWVDVPWQPGTLAATAISASGEQVATVSRTTNGKATALTLSLDSPSEATGTGSALFLDGQDVALVRATVVDWLGHVVHLASHKITFSIVSGPGWIQGTANGDPRSFQAHTSPSHTAYHGLVRAVVRVTSTAGFSAREKELLQWIDAADSTATGLSDSDDRDIVIQATSPGFSPAQLRIRTSTNSSTSSVLAVAQAGAGKPVNFFHEDRSSAPLSIE